MGSSPDGSNSMNSIELYRGLWSSPWLWFLTVVFQSWACKTKNSYEHYRTSATASSSAVCLGPHPSVLARPVALQEFWGLRPTVVRAIVSTLHNFQVSRRHFHQSLGEKKKKIKNWPIGKNLVMRRVQPGPAVLQNVLKTCKTVNWKSGLGRPGSP